MTTTSSTPRLVAAMEEGYSVSAPLGETIAGLMDAVVALPLANAARIVEES